MNIQSHINLLPYNTFQFSCIADHFVQIQTIEDRQELVKTKIFVQNKKLILGGGSNILLTQDHFHGLVIKNEIMGKEIITHDNETVTIKVGAGENWNDFVLRSIEQGYHGIENLVSIPGTVGAAPMQNIGAYGVEAGDLITEVISIDYQGNTSTLSRSECQFGYRDSVFKNDLKDNACIAYVMFELKRYNSESYIPNMKYGAIEHKVKELQEMRDERGEKKYLTTDNRPPITPSLIAQAVADIRASKLPDWKIIGTAGSFFKNPIIPEQMYITLKEQFPDLVGHPAQFGILHLKSGIKLSAGQLIDLSGLKGLDRGSVGTYHHHALILIHIGGGRGEDIVKLCRYIQEKVYEKFQVHIEPEVNFV